jgi:hypothetical protein
MALVMTAASTDAMNSAHATHRGQASGVMNTLKQVGGTVGLAIMGTAVTTVQHDRLTDYANRVGASAADRAHFKSVVAAAHGEPALLHSLPAATLGALRDSLVSAIGTAYLIAGGRAHRSGRVSSAPASGACDGREAALCERARRITSATWTSSAGSRSWSGC